MDRFIEATVLYRSAERDPGEPPDRAEKRLFNLSEIVLVYPNARGNGHTWLSLKDGGLFQVTEPYEYFVAALTSWQPREVGV